MPNHFHPNGVARIRVKGKLTREVVGTTKTYAVRIAKKRIYTSNLTFDRDTGYETFMSHRVNSNYSRRILSYQITGQPEVTLGQSR